MYFDSAASDFGWPEMCLLPQKEIAFFESESGLW